MGNRIEEVFQKVDRQNFLPPEVADESEIDWALPIGYGQTNSQPTTVRLMLEWLDVGLGQKVLDVGSGSGWTTALLSHLVGPKGRVIAVEIVPELVEFGKTNCQKLGLKNVEFHLAKQTLGWSEGAPYDRILVSAAADRVPTELIDQLANNGRMVIPVQDSVMVVNKDKNGEMTTESHYGFVFVPLIN